MNRVLQYISTICMMVTIAFLAGGAFAHPLEEGRRKIVVFREGTPGQVQQKVAEEVRGRVLHRLSLVNGIAMELPTQRAMQALEALQRHPLVAEVHDDPVIGADHVVQLKPAVQPEKELFPWGVSRIGAPEAREVLTAGSIAKPRVVILDTGLDKKHADLAPNMTGGYNARAGENSQDFNDYNGHGTHMAGIIAAGLNSRGIIGVASFAKLVPVKVLDKSGHGYLSDLIKGLQWAAANGARVVNMSLSFSEHSSLLEKAVRNLHDAGVIMVAAVGNRCTFGKTGGAMDSGADDSGADDSGADDSGADSAGSKPNCDVSQDPLRGGVNYPARYPWVIAVAATDIYNRVTSYSRSGPEVVVVAPGGSSANPILSTVQEGRYGLGSGTSQAAAHVTGAIAAALEINPMLSFTQIVNLLQTTATDLGYPPERQGAGLVNVQKMVRQLSGLP